MSKTLSKTLVIIAMIVILPLMVIGTVLATYFSVDASFTAAVYAGEVAGPSESFAVIEYDGKSDTKFTITNGQQKEVTLKALSNGFDFLGWFNGTEKQYKEASKREFVSTKNELKVKMTDYSDILAVFDITKYTVAYDYKLHGDDTTNTTDIPENGKTGYNFGETLPVLTYENYDFLGWRIVGDKTLKIYTTATFEQTEDITLEAVWKEHGKIKLQYVVKGEEDTILKEEDIYLGNVVVLETVDTLAADYIKNGYTYSWADSTGASVVQVNLPESYENDFYTVTLKETAIEYTASLETTEGTTFNGNKTVTFTAKSYENLKRFFNAENYTLKYSFFEFAGVTLNNVDVTADELVTKVVTENPKATTSVALVMKVTEHFTKFDVKTGITCQTTTGENIFKYGEYTEGEDFNYNTYINSPKTFNSDKTIYDLLNMNFDEGLLKLYDKNGVEVKYSSLKITTIINGEEMTIDVYLDGTAKLYDVIQAFYNHSAINSSLITIGDSFEVTNIIASFE